MLDNLLTGIDKGMITGMLFLDFRKAFDTVSHERLVEKLYWYGIRGIPQLWFKNFLSQRVQVTVLGETESNGRIVKCGVPQGSILGPLLYILYVNDMKLAVRNSKISLYADDTALYMTGNSCHELQNHTSI